VLVVDDDADVRSLLTDLLKGDGYRVRTAKTGAEALAAVEKERPELEIIVMTAFGGSSSAIKAMEHGAYDYVTKPFEIDDLLATLRRVFEHAAMSEEVSALRLELGKTAAVRERIVGSSRPMLEVYKLIGKVAGSDATVLITGESGTGKELVAEALHKASKRNPHPLVKVSCAALPETLLETELFGHEKGSFTGAMTMRKGRFESANKGTIFLDEIGEMTLGTQTKLLRILQEHEFERIGSNTPIKVDIRVIAATNRNLADEVDAGGFREDLYYRLNVIHIHMPPMRERMEDIPQLVEHFLAKYRAKPDAIPTPISEEAVARLMEHDWPGNVRELENAIERAVVLSRGATIMPEHLPLAESPASAGGRARSRKGPAAKNGDGAVDSDETALVGEAADAAAANENGNGVGGSFKEAVESLEKRLIAEALERNHGNRSKAAEELGIYRRLLYAKMREYGLGE
jgi:two-component system response regulator AtoC